MAALVSIDGFDFPELSTYNATKKTSWTIPKGLFVYIIHQYL